jgi:hypothetical protein
MTVSKNNNKNMKILTIALFVTAILLSVSSEISYSESKGNTSCLGDSILLNFTTVNATNYNTADGSILLKVSGGTPPYRINYMPVTADTTQLFIGDSLALNNLLMGGYVFSVFDSVGNRNYNAVIIDKK